ncbi:NAD(P)H-binding protein [Flavobacterium sp. DG1-102-2]|uniref:NAD(P)H-binding protein n=1 Tax=Flavobacterium sp. DG1-102-2 TaxID=3081663 RepID=UPI002949CF33|nr:NAD(P)H-binding protein [Flavobacterium sp. DG1-102-2]MDV6169590.1 NAD(P)H-binding protein [Flavobacterium sp. DG1-102-2]
MSKSAILLGASGAVGSEVLKLLLADTRYDTIKLFSRSKSDVSNPKLEEHVIDLFRLSDYKAVFTADEVYCCIGTTKAQTPDKDTYYKIDYGIPVVAAQLAKENGIKTYIVISAIGADAESGIFYNRTKGEMQDAVLNENLPKTHILQPSLIVAKRKDKRIMEKAAQGFMWLLNPLLFGNAAKYKSISADSIAKAMLWLANNSYQNTIVSSDKIKEISRK